VRLIKLVFWGIRAVQRGVDGCAVWGGGREENSEVRWLKLFHWFFFGGHACLCSLVWKSWSWISIVSWIGLYRNKSPVVWMPATDVLFFLSLRCVFVDLFAFVTND
jgi:hypothetical protein